MKHYFQKYGIACMIGLVIFVLILPVQVFAAGEDFSSENSRTEDNMTETDLEKTQEETEQKNNIFFQISTPISLLTYPRKLLSLHGKSSCFFRKKTVYHRTFVLQ